jgi:peptide chain release factor 1
VIVEIQGGAGGDEASLWAGDIYRMLTRYAERRSWQVEQLDVGDGKYTFAIKSPPTTADRPGGAYSVFKFEGGTHRVQRVPETEAQGRIHTSAITVAVLLEPDEEEKVQLNETELKIDTYRASGAGGQHVNTTDSAVRITHLPTGIVACCQDERSQHKNKDKAMRLLSAKIAEERRRKTQEERDLVRSTQVGSGDRSERIRTYNFPQNRVTDHRIDLTLYKLDRIMEGEVDELVEALVAHFYAQKLAT